MSALRRYLAVIQDPRGYPPTSTLDPAPPEGPTPPELVAVVRVDEHDAEVERLREALRGARECISAVHYAGFDSERKRIVTDGVRAISEALDA